MPRRALALACLALVLVLPDPARAHAVKIFAAVEGQAIVGEVYFAGGGPAAGAKVVALDEEGAVLARTEADVEGRFRLPVTRRVGHHIIADTGGGHAASTVIPADTLPAAPDEEAQAALDDALEAAVARQIAPLRRDILRLEEWVLWRDLLGGLGYILGLFGVAAFLLSRRQSRLGPQQAAHHDANGERQENRRNRQ